MASAVIAGVAASGAIATSMANVAIATRMASEAINHIQHKLQRDIDHWLVPLVQPLWPMQPVKQSIIHSTSYRGIFIIGQCG